MHGSVNSAWVELLFIRDTVKRLWSLLYNCTLCSRCLHRVSQSVQRSVQRRAQLLQWLVPTASESEQLAVAAHACIDTSRLMSAW
jgi:hypothetical protein